VSLSAALFLSPTVNRLANLTPVLPHLRMLLSHVEYGAEGWRCTMVCCGPNCSEQRSARRRRMASAVGRGSAASQRSMSARCASYPVAGRHKSYPSTASPEPRGYWDRAADRRGIARKGGVPANWPIKCGLAIPIRAF